MDPIEKGVIDLFSNADFYIDDVHYYVDKACKPTVVSGGGEPKTDIYVRAWAEDDPEAEPFEIKISCKKDNADFVANKLTRERSETILGDDWYDRVSDAIIELMDYFEMRPLYYPNKVGHTRATSFTLGWRFDIVRKESGDLCYPLVTTTEEKIEALTGEHNDDSKHHCKCDGEVIHDSGIPEYVYYGHLEESSAQEIVNNLYTIAEFADMHDDMYLAAKAVNYCFEEDSWEKSRWLLVPVYWGYDPTLDQINGYADASWDVVLTENSTNKGNELKQLLLDCGIETPDQIIPGESINEEICCCD